MIEHISGTVSYILHVNITANKITFEKSENLEKKFIQVRTWLKFNICFLILHGSSYIVPEELVFENIGKKCRQIVLPNLDEISS